MTTFWRRQSQSGGNYPPIPQTAPGVPYWPQTLPPGTVVGRLSANPGPTEAIPFAYLVALLKSTLPVQIETGVGTITLASDTQVLILNKSSPSATAITLPRVFVRNKVQVEIYDWTGLAGDMVLTPFGTEKIMGANSPWTIGSGGVAQSGGSVRMLPLTDINGWVVR